MFKAHIPLALLCRKNVHFSSLVMQNQVLYILDVLSLCNDLSFALNITPAEAIYNALAHIIIKYHSQF